MRTECRACDSKKLEQILDLGMQPLAGGFLKDDADAKEKEKQYPLPVHVCADCGLVQTLYVVPADVLFTNYFFSSSTIPALVKHFELYADWIIKKLNPKKVVEFGCNDGILLTPLKNKGVQTYGCDISENITELTRSKGHQVMTGFFDQKNAVKIIETFGKADVVTGSNCFPHNDNPEEILKAAKIALNENGHLCLEVMYAGDLYDKLQWDSMYHEHLNYFCLKTLDVLLRKNGFHAVHAELLEMHAGTLRVIAAVNPSEKPDESVHALLKLEEEKKLTSVATWQDFGKKVNRQIEITKKVMKDLSGKGRVWGYGAAGRATMWVNACDMNYLEFMIDSSPLRSGRLMPGTHTPIVFPEALKINPPDYIFVPAWNYIDIIKEKESWFKGIWCVPLPDFKFL
ncbi:MAG: methyltransferase domain-containing protein [Bdellovibrionaceae bacterium]|nr:methyltransferase domain-containing protein [Pseudobdellovibrionaceae bacterium]